MARSFHRALIAALFLLALPPTAAWSPQTRVGLVDDAVRLMPASLRTALEGHHEDLLRGALEPMVDESGADHRAPWDTGRLEQRLEADVLALIESLGRPGSFPSIARKLGGLAHFVSDAGFPPGVSTVDGDGRYEHFAAFCESRREKFPLVFYGHDDPELARGDYRAFAVRTMRLAGDLDLELARAYAAAGSPPDPEAFDDRSVPFAVGSLAYSRTVTNIVRLWLAAWQNAGGDMGRTPYLKPPPPGSVDPG